MLNETINILNDLNLYGLKNNISSEIDYITNNNLPFLEGLNHFLKSEVKYREINRAEANIKVAHFPYLKEIKDFDFDYQPSINKNIINDLATLRFIEEKKNILFMGSPGVGKTHLATALGIEAAKKRNSVYFISCNDLITNLSNAFKENRLESKIKFYCKYKLLIIDEIGYLPITKDEANMIQVFIRVDSGLVPYSFVAQLRNQIRQSMRGMKLEAETSFRVVDELKWGF